MHTHLLGQDMRQFIVTSPFGWAKAKTIAEAKRLCKRETPSGQRRKPSYKAMLCHPDTTINTFRVNWPNGYEPIHLGEV